MGCLSTTNCKLIGAKLVNISLLTVYPYQCQLIFANQQFRFFLMPPSSEPALPHPNCLCRRVVYPFHVYKGQQGHLDYFQKNTWSLGEDENISATMWEVRGLHHRGMNRWWEKDRLTIGKISCLDDNRFQNTSILCGHHKKANLDRPATPIVHDWHLGSGGWGNNHSEPHHLIVRSVRI